MDTRYEYKYDRLRKIGIGSYGVVFKCLNRHTGQFVAIKRYSENDSDPVIRKIAMREVRMLRQLKHPNIINLIEIFRRKRRLHLVFDYCELTVLDVIEKYADNCPVNLIKRIIWQTVNAINYCHSHNCIHRDIKPENILITQSGVVKLCDFGFARSLVPSGSLATTTTISSTTAITQRARSSSNGQQVAELLDSRNQTLERQALTEYVATRWYRAPELLIGDSFYTTKIDIWAIGCVAGELMRGEPIWPGKTDFDQLNLIQRSLGSLTQNQTQTLLAQTMYDQPSLEQVLSLNASKTISDPVDRKIPLRVGRNGCNLVVACLQMDPSRRPTSQELLKHAYIHSTRMDQFLADQSKRQQSAAQTQRQPLANATSGLNGPTNGAKRSLASSSQKGQLSWQLQQNQQVPAPELMVQLRAGQQLRKDSRQSSESHPKNSMIPTALPALYSGNLERKLQQQQQQHFGNPSSHPSPSTQTRASQQKRKLQMDHEVGLENLSQSRSYLPISVGRNGDVSGSSALRKLRKTSVTETPDQTSKVASNVTQKRLSNVENEATRTEQKASKFGYKMSQRGTTGSQKVALSSNGNKIARGNCAPLAKRLPAISAGT